MLVINWKQIYEYDLNNKIANITKKDNDAILKIIKKYYTFGVINETNVRKKTNISKRDREKVLI